MGVSENSVPLNPMVLLIIIPIKWLFHWEYTPFSDKPIFSICFAPLILPGYPGPGVSGPSGPVCLSPGPGASVEENQK